MNYIVNMAVVNYFWTQILEVQKSNDHMQIKSADLYGKDLTDLEDQFAAWDVLLSENLMILTVKD